MPGAKDIGCRLHKLRGDRTAQTVADAIGVAVSTILMYEAGQRIPKDKVKVKLANYFNVSVEALFYAENDTISAIQT